MIKIQYDTQTAGVRISFVVRDTEKPFSPNIGEFTGKTEDGVLTCPETPENLEVVQELLKCAMAYAEELNADS